MSDTTFIDVFGDEVSISTIVAIEGGAHMVQLETRIAVDTELDESEFGRDLFVFDPSQALQLADALRGAAHEAQASNYEHMTLDQLAERVIQLEHALEEVGGADVVELLRARNESARPPHTTDTCDCGSATYWLANGVELNEASPDAFHIPSDAAKRALKVGDVVKLEFIPATAPADGPGQERMWVQLTDVHKDGLFMEFKGILDNEPVIIKGIAHGDEVTRFGPENIVGIYDAAGGAR